MLGAMLRCHSVTERERDGRTVCHDKCFRDGNNLFLVRNVTATFHRINFDSLEILRLGDSKSTSLLC